jgi:hypothetical protein
MPFKVLPDFYFPTEPVQVRFPRSKKKRMRKKWRKNPRNWSMTTPDAYKVAGVLFIPESLYRRISAEMADTSGRNLQYLIEAGMLRFPTGRPKTKITFPPRLERPSGARTTFYNTPRHEGSLLDIVTPRPVTGLRPTFITMDDMMNNDEECV